MLGPAFRRLAALVSGISAEPDVSVPAVLV